ncbi:MAG: hypothetical protein ACREB5_11030, partial [Sphingomonadaceae bacterium]
MNETARRSTRIADDASPRLDAARSEASVRALVARYGSPLLLIDCDSIRSQYRALAAALPGVDLHYALKPLPEETVVRVLAAEGSWFDLATSGEVDLVRRAGVEAGRCIHTHPIKRDIDIRHALDFGVTTFIADNPDEIDKFAPYAGHARLLLRVAFRSRQAMVDLSRKFGCEPQATLDLARRAASIGVRVSGLSFHVGSQVADPAMYSHAVITCAALMTAAGRAGLAPFEMLDIGGGFPIEYLKPVPPIHEFCRPIREALAALPKGIRVIAEPGRFICGPAGIGIATVMGRAKREGRWWYYLDDGIYGTFSGQLY